MRLLHTGDLHIGKRLYEFSLVEDQQHILGELRRLARAEKVDALVLAGDIYDKTLPPAEAVTVLDDFLTGLHRDGIPVLLISGNHDSPERLRFGARLLANGGIHIAAGMEDAFQPWLFQRGAEKVQFWLLPYVYPAAARRALGDESLQTYDQAVSAMVRAMARDPACRQVLVAHQFVVNGGETPKQYESEQISVGGMNQVEAGAFAGFDYVALGHLHGPQQVGRPTVRYAGSPLAYSFSELDHDKSAVLLDIPARGPVEIRLLPLEPLRRLRQIRGRLDQLLDPAVAAAADREDYIRAVLTNEEDLVQPLAQLRRVYPNVMQLAFENSRSGPGLAADSGPRQPEKSPLEHFEDFYAQQQGQPPTREKLELVRRLLETIGEEEA